MKKQHLIHINTSLCIGCGLCRQDCPEHNIHIEGKKAVLADQECMKCGHCVAICPKGAVSITGYEEESKPYAVKTVLESQQLLKALQTRRSIRQFQKKDVEEGVIEQIIEAGRLTPSGVNAQNVSYIVLKEGRKEIERNAVRFFARLKPIVNLFMKKARKVKIDDDFFFKGAPAVIMIVSKSQINGALAAADMALMAESLGLGVLYNGLISIAAKYSPAVRKQLHLKHGYHVVTTLVIGYPAVVYHRTVQREPAAVTRK